MKAFTFIFLLMGAQISTTPAADIKIKMSSTGLEYCQGSTAFYAPYLTGIAEGPNDIKLRLRVKLWYVSYRTETNILPPQTRFFTRMIVPGQNAPTILRNAGGGTDPKTVLASATASPASAFSLYAFSILTPQNPAAPELLQCLSAKDPSCISDQVTIAIVDRASGLDLRGKTIQILMTREHALAPDVAQKLNDKWKQYGTIWSGAVDAEPLTIRVPDDPSPRDCRQ